MQSRNQQLIKIIKRSRKIFSHQEGGVWKIAYADFITSMMIFFLCMWLLSTINNTGKSLFSETFKQAATGHEGGESVLKMQYLIEREMKQRREAIKKNLLQTAAPLSGNLSVEVLDNGVRIQIMDSSRNSIFESGSAKPTATAKAIFKAVAASVSALPNKITIEGHTDSVPYSKGEITNWELSTMRASAARIELENDGVPATRIDKVVGYADTRPIINTDPADRRNRRISIFIGFEQLKVD